MKVHADYTQIVSRILGSEKQKVNEHARLSAPPAEDRQELSRVMTLLQQELKRIEAEPSPARTERLRQLEAEISRGDYRVDDEALASALLDY